MEANQGRMATMNISLPEALRRFIEMRAMQPIAAEAFLVGAAATTPNRRLRPRPRWAFASTVTIATTTLIGRSCCCDVICS